MATSHLGRLIDPTVASNRTILIISVIASAAGFGRWNDGELWPSLVRAGLIGFVVFMSWAFTRELDPDHATAATLAALLTLGAAMFVEPILVLPLVGFTIAARILTRSTGRPPKILDLIALILGSFLLGRSGAGWVAALILAFAVARDRTLPGLPTSKFGRIIAPFLIAVVASVSVAVFSFEVFEVPPWWMIAVAGVGLVAGLSTRPYVPQSRCDLRGEPLVPARMQSARRTVVTGALLVSALGTIGITPMLPVWLAFVAVRLQQTSLIPEFHPIER